MFRYTFLVMLICCMLPTARSFGEEGVHHCRFASIQYEEPGQLEEFARKIQPGALTVSLNQIFMGGGTSTLETKAGRCVDQLFQRVQAILEMHKPDLKVKLRLYGNHHGLNEEFLKISGKPTQAPAFYWRETNTIYLHLEKITSGILAHEMAHAVIAHFFIVSPPVKISELLCQYVDREVSRGSF